jgi:hypothetical protein
MIGADLVRAAALLLLAAVPDAGQVFWLFPAVFMIGCGRSVFEATLAAATPALAGAQRSQVINSALSALKGVAMVAGMWLATIAVPAIGFRGVFILDAGTYLLSALVLLSVPLRLRDSSPPAGARAAPTAGRPLGWAVLVAAGLASLVVVRGVDAFGSAAHHVGLPLLGSLLEPANPARVVGAAWGAWALGTLTASLLLRPMLAGQVARSPVAVFGMSTVVMSAGFIAIFWLDDWRLMLVAAAVAGLGDALSEITFRQAIQQLPDQDRGGAFGAAQVVINVGFVIGLLVAGASATVSNIALLVLVMHGVAMAAATWLALRVRLKVVV